MAHLLLLDVPGGNDFTVLEDAVREGHQVTFFTGDVAQYIAQGDDARAALRLAREVVEVHPFTAEALQERALAIHAELAFEAVLCILDIRIVDAALLAEALGLRFLNVSTARMARDKVQVRRALARRGLRQPAFAEAGAIDQIRHAVETIGYPAVVKPVDGYASQNVRILHTALDLEKLLTSLAARESQATDYGFGIQANDRFSVERYISGHLIGCDVFVGETERVVLGINDKLMFPPPSCAIRGSCFPSEQYDTAAISAYAFAILDAIGFDFGACHIEMIVDQEGPYLVEVNPRLVSAQIPHQMGYALSRSIYVDLINLHLGLSLETLRTCVQRRQFSAIRWLSATQPGVIKSIRLPTAHTASIRRVAVFKDVGDWVRPPLSNSDRIAYVIAVGATQGSAEDDAERYASEAEIVLV